jgi:hypothetical protein
MLMASGATSTSPAITEESLKRDRRPGRRSAGPMTAAHSRCVSHNDLRARAPVTRIRRYSRFDGFRRMVVVWVSGGDRRPSWCSPIPSETLARWARRRTSVQALELRCRIVLACADELTNQVVAVRVGGESGAGEQVALTVRRASTRGAGRTGRRVTPQTSIGLRSATSASPDTRGRPLPRAVFAR